MELESNLILMVLFTKDNGNKVKRVDMVNYLTMKGYNFKEYSLKV
jgi:hypothetical protein